MMDAHGLLDASDVVLPSWTKVGDSDCFRTPDVEVVGFEIPVTMHGSVYA